MKFVDGQKVKRIEWPDESYTEYDDMLICIESDGSIWVTYAKNNDIYKYNTIHTSVIVI